ncbi:MAG: GNAT family N-acetyltransferase [Deltaproteobacteria bacterium]|nr:GNAT family N-acetyltransferase [Deltaproteobacteria bacterium]
MPSSGAQRAGFTLETTDWATSEAELYAVRRAVFVEEQHVPRELEVDEADPVALHLLVRDADARPIGTGRLAPDGRIGRMAVLAEWRGRGVGAAILERLVGVARERGLAEVVAAAQVRAVGFYERHGFRAAGPVFDDAGLPHRTMHRRLGR